MPADQSQGVTPDETATIYRSMPWMDLVVLRSAFVVDRRLAALDGKDASVTFCDERIKAIDAELLSRNKATN